jgi:hypothetical protein
MNVFCILILALTRRDFLLGKVKYYWECDFYDYQKG